MFFVHLCRDVLVVLLGILYLIEMVFYCIHDHLLSTLKAILVCLRSQNQRIR